MAESQVRINVFSTREDAIDGSGDIIARVRLNTDLDYWDGHNWQNGDRGLHKGITKLKDGRYVILISSQWQGSRDYGYVVSPEEALQEILKAGHEELLSTYKLRGLKPLLKELAEEDDDEEKGE